MLLHPIIFLMGDFIRFINVSNFGDPSSLLVQRKQTGFSTDTSSEAKIAVCKVKQLGWRIRCVLFRKEVGSIGVKLCVNSLTLLCKDNPQRWCFPISANICYIRWIDVLNKVKLLMKFSVSFHMETMSDIIRANRQSLANLLRFLWDLFVLGINMLFFRCSLKWLFLLIL